MKLYFIISRLLFSGHFLRELFHRLLHRGISLKHTNRWEASHKRLIETLLTLWIREHSWALDDRMSLTAGASLQMQGMISGSPTGVLHNTLLQVQLIESGYEWQAAACKWPSACEWGHGGRVHQKHDKWGALHFAMHAEAEIRRDNNSQTISGVARQVRVCQNTTWQDMSMKCVRTAHKANVFRHHMHSKSCNDVSD